MLKLSRPPKMSLTLYSITSVLLGLLLAACQSPGTSQGATKTDPRSLTNDTTAATLRKSPNDDREYRYLTLDNKLRVLLVSDPATDKSAAALSVYRGTFHEPKNRSGLAHFLEHMLFIQTDTYPEIDGFQQYISANGGSSNAYTAQDHTNYFFDVQPNAFSEGLDRFGHFFIDPILSAEYANREKNAVHSEYQMQLKDDGWRGFMASKQALNPEHPGQRFSIGSLDTLAGDIQADLKTFFNTQYSADQMGLVVLSKESLDELEVLVTPLFDQIKNSDIGPDYPDVPPYTEEQLPATLRVKTLKDGSALSYHFPLPNTLPNYRVKPEQYVANLLGHEGTGSLYQSLSKRGWIESLSASVGEFDRFNSIFSVRIELTPQGVKHGEEITHALFAYIELIRNTPPQAWLYEEQARVAQLGFQFQEKSRPTSLVYQMAPRLDKYPPKDLLVAPYLMERFDAELIRESMSYLTPENMLMEVTGPDVETDATEPWFGVAYAIEKGNAAAQSTSTADLGMPSPNPFLPDDLALQQTDSTEIQQLIKAPGITLYYDGDVQYGAPRALTNLELLVEGGLHTPADRAIGQLYRSMVQDSLSELSYPAYLAGLSYSIGVSDAGFQVSIGGYHDKQLALLDDVLQHFSAVELKEDRFQALKASMIKDWRNSAKDRPYAQAVAALDDTLRSGRWPRPMLIDALSPVTLEDLNTWRGQKLSALGVVGLLYGNASPARASALETLLSKRLTIQATDKYRPKTRDVQRLLRLNIPVEHDDAALVLHVQNQDESFTSRAISSLAAQIMHPEYFRELRTEQQLGYVVSISNRPVVKRGGITFIVQSPVKGAAGLEQATKDFMQRFNATWPQTTDTAFDQYKSGLINRLLQKPKNLGEQSQRYWSDLMDGYLSFDSRQQVAEIVAGLSRETMTAYFKNVAQRLEERRLLIYTDGKFSDTPAAGQLLDSPTASF